jgi:hypothetical protein
MDRAPSVDGHVRLQSADRENACPYELKPAPYTPYSVVRLFGAIEGDNDFIDRRSYQLSPLLE